MREEWCRGGIPADFMGETPSPSTLLASVTNQAIAGEWRQPPARRSP
jgi:hypothetical protein